MIFKEQELHQLDERFIRRLLEQDPEALAGLSIKLVSDLKEALERLNQNPSNSSRPSGSLAPWAKDIGCDEDDDEANSDEKAALRSAASEGQEASSEKADTVAADNAPSETTQETHAARKPGRQQGSPGFGRTQKLAITDTVTHPCGGCRVCGEDLAAVERAYTGFQTVNVAFGDTNAPGLSLSNVLHLYYQGLCPKCGLENRAEPARAPADTADWKSVGLTEWRLIGPDLAALIVYLSVDMRVTRRKVKRFLEEVLGLELSLGTLQNCIVESARALAPVEAQLIDDLCAESVMHADESVPRRRAQKVKVLQCSSAAQEMRVGPSESPYRRRLQTPYCCCV